MQVLEHLLVQLLLILGKGSSRGYRKRQEECQQSLAGVGHLVGEKANGASPGVDELVVLAIGHTPEPAPISLDDIMVDNMISCSQTHALE